jgi:hypothetical protein
MSQITMQCVPAYDLEAQQEVMPIDRAMATIDAAKDHDRHIELLVFPRGGTAIVKRLLATTRPASTHAVDSGWSDDIPLWLSAQLSRVVPGILGPLHRNLALFVSRKSRVGRSYDIFPSERRVRFAEMEYQVPAARGLEALAAVSAAIARLAGPLAFPIEYRYVAGDDGWLSPFEGGARASISVHQFHAISPEPLFAAVEPILRAHQGRPHWGKLHSLDARALAPL